MNDKMMQMIEMMMSKHKGKPGEYGKEAEDMEEGYGEEGEDESEDETEVTIKFCGKDAMKKAHDLLMANYKK